jgi:hypothetical protein
MKIGLIDVDGHNMAEHKKLPMVNLNGDITYGIPLEEIELLKKYGFNPEDVRVLRRDSKKIFFKVNEKYYLIDKEEHNG